MLIQADARAIPLIDGCVHCIVTSPPYWGSLRDYGHPLQLGLEREPMEYVDQIVTVFRELRRVLRADGTVWLNLADAYAASGKGGGGNCGDRASWSTIVGRKGFRMPPCGYKQKDLVLTSFAVAASLQADGWYLRAVVIWAKPSAVEPLRLDRPSVSHEYIFLLAQQEQYSAYRGHPAMFSTVWECAADASYPEHPATMPEEIVRRCIALTTTTGDLIFDPFSGSGTVLAVAERLGRRGVGTDLNPAYHLLAKDRTAQRGLRFTAESEA